MSKTNNLTVADFYCGAGGFSEGFRQMGFKIIFALDNWAPARETHKLNHPDCKHPGLDCYPETQGDILSIKKNLINEIVDDTNIIVGSPPCVSFSMANKAGKADKSLGIKLIKKFLQIVAVKKHKPNSKLRYWLMENVPNSRNFIKPNYTFKMLGLTNKDLKIFGINKKESDVALTIDLDINKTKYNSVFYGVPQRRERFICGEFPLPKETTKEEFEWVKLGKIIDSLHSNEKKSIYDPLYNFSIPTKEITDHFYDTIIPRFEWEETMIKKQQARYYGKMSFPEDQNKPARTVVATRSVLARESMILPNGKPGNFRSPTVREVASLMSFPINYIFQAKDESSKYRLIGNAVCPKMISEFAKAILAKEMIHIPSKPYISNPAGRMLKVDLRISPPPIKKPRDKLPLANFAEIVPNVKFRNFRVELDNNFPFRKPEVDVTWNASIHHATGKDSMKKAIPKEEDIISFLYQFEDKKLVEKFILSTKKSFNGLIPSAEEFQNQYCSAKRNPEILNPRAALRMVSEIVELYFPAKDYEGFLLSNIKDLGKMTKYFNFNRGEVPNNLIPLRVGCALFACNYISNLTKNKVKKPNVNGMAIKCYYPLNSKILIEQ